MWCTIEVHSSCGKQTQIIHRVSDDESGEQDFLTAGRLDGDT